MDNYNTEDVDAHNYNNINHVIFACHAGMGSSAMGASMLRNKFKKAGINDITVTNTAINQLPKDAQLVITQEKKLTIVLLNKHQMPSIFQWIISLIHQDMKNF